jgi:hypothetical protein
VRTLTPNLPADKDHHALRQSGDPHVDRYALVNVETDRVVNRISTLSEHVLGYTKDSPHL